MITLRANDLQWVDGSTDCPYDQCAHGRVHFQIGKAVFVRPNDGVLTVSAAALYLMRTLEHNHTKENSVAPYSFLFPWDGFGACPYGGPFAFYACGGPNGIDPEVIHKDDQVELRLDAKKATIFCEEWRAAVFSFSDQVFDFYQRSSPREVPEDELEQAGWQAFWREWAHRRRINRMDLKIFVPYI